MGTDIDTIFKMLSWNSSEKEQLRVQIMLKRNASSATAERLFHF